MAKGLQCRKTRHVCTRLFLSKHTAMFERSIDKTCNLCTSMITLVVDNTLRLITVRINEQAAMTLTYRVIEALSSNNIEKNSLEVIPVSFRVAAQLSLYAFRK